MAGRRVACETGLSAYPCDSTQGSYLKHRSLASCVDSSCIETSDKLLVGRFRHFLFLCQNARSTSPIRMNRGDARSQRAPGAKARHAPARTFIRATHTSNTVRSASSLSFGRTLTKASSCGGVLGMAYAGVAPSRSRARVLARVRYLSTVQTKAPVLSSTSSTTCSTST